ncbi:MAG: acyl-CoA thioesterase [Bacteroidetes bacterium]|nr:MAG: acyl-CoA thioesterase [Bacteroidota bacterium]
MYNAETTIRVRYSETDQMEYVYYGNYAAYYEVARVEGLRQLGLSYKDLEDSGIMMPVLETHSYYHKPAKYDELLTIKVTIPQLPLVKIKFEYIIYAENGDKIHSGDTTLVFINMSNGKPTRAPEVMKNLLAPFFNEK